MGWCINYEGRWAVPLTPELRERFRAIVMDEAYELSERSEPFGPVLTPDGRGFEGFSKIQSSEEPLGDYRRVVAALRAIQELLPDAQITVSDDYYLEEPTPLEDIPPEAFDDDEAEAQAYQPGVSCVFTGERPVVEAFHSVVPLLRTTAAQSGWQEAPTKGRRFPSDRRVVAVARGTCTRWLAILGSDELWAEKLSTSLGTDVLHLSFKGRSFERATLYRAGEPVGQLAESSELPEDIWAPLWAPGYSGHHFSARTWRRWMTQALGLDSRLLQPRIDEETGNLGDKLFLFLCPEPPSDAGASTAPAPSQAPREPKVLVARAGDRFTVSAQVQLPPEATGVRGLMLGSALDAGLCRVEQLVVMSGGEPQRVTPTTLETDSGVLASGVISFGAERPEAGGVLEIQAVVRADALGAGELSFDLKVLGLASPLSVTVHRELEVVPEER